MKYQQKNLYPGDRYDGYEQDTVNLFRQIIQPNWTVFDCGAKTGYFTLLFAELCCEGKVHAFEPTKTFQMLKDNIDHYQLSNIQLNNLALGESVGDIEDNIYRIWGKPPEKQIYKFTTIDKYCEDNNIQELNLIKIDVDSYDFEVLKGSINVLKNLKPIITVELNHALFLRNSKPEEVIAWMKENNYIQTNVTDENFTFKAK